MCTDQFSNNLKIKSHQNIFDIKKLEQNIQSQNPVCKETNLTNFGLPCILLINSYTLYSFFFFFIEFI